MEVENQVILDEKYIRLSKLGSGGTANVYLVRDMKTNEEYAAKVLKSENVDFEKEVNILKLINHPNIINIKGGGIGSIVKNCVPGPNVQYIILELAKKGELFDYVFLPKEGFGEKFGRYIFKKILSGLNACHEAGIAHRDLKMENVMLDENFNPKLADFGFATLVQGKNNDGLLSTPLGTQQYAAPEILLHKPYDGIKADTFSMGVLLFTLVTCKIGFFEATRKDPYYRLIMTKFYKNYWKNVEQQVSGLSENFKNFFIKLITFNYKDRPTYQQMLEDPWMKEETPSEQEMLAEFERRFAIVQSQNEGQGMYIEDEEALNERGAEDEVFFSLDLQPTKFNRDDIKARRFVKITSEIEPSKFMNALCNALKNKDDSCNIEPSSKNLKFDVTFKKEQEDIKNENEEEILKELEKLGIKDEEQNEDLLTSTIKVVLAQTEKNEYLLYMYKTSGQLDQFYENYEKVKNCINSLL